MMTAKDAQRRDTLPAKVIEALPNDLFRVELENRSPVLAHVSSRRQNDFLRLLPGDRVRVSLSPSDHTRGRIVGRCKS